MLIKLFFVYFILFAIIFSYPNLKHKEKSGIFLKLIAIPAALAIIVAFFSLVKIFIIYKILLLLLSFVTFFLTYRQWKGYFQRWRG